MRSRREEARKRAEEEAAERKRDRRRRRAKQQREQAAFARVLHGDDKRLEEFRARFAGSGLEDVLVARASRLTEREWWPALARIGEHREHWLRRPEDWRPKGRGTRTLLASLIEHLFCSYPTKQFLYGVFCDENLREVDRPALIALFIQIAKGASLYKLLRTDELGHLPPLTHKMCKLFLDTKKQEGMVGAFRIAQLKADGGDSRLAAAICASRVLGQRIGENEAFWATVIQWLSRQHMLAASQVEPLLDYIAFCHEVDASWSIKGRTVQSVSRAMADWHAELARYGNVVGVFPKSGLRAWSHVRTPRGGPPERWTVDEIVTATELAQEGRAQANCVFSYWRDIMRGVCSIWSLKLDGKRRLTIEVRNQQKLVVQIRGRFNRLPDERELGWVRQWAASNALRVSSWAARHW